MKNYEKPKKGEPYKWENKSIILVIRGKYSTVSRVTEKHTDVWYLDNGLFVNPHTMEVFKKKGNVLFGTRIEYKELQVTYYNRD